MAALLLTVAGERKRVSLGERVEIGRSPECDIVLSDASISRRHARVEFRSGAYYLIDLQSRFGCYVNDEPAREACLHSGDRLKLGNIALEFEDTAEAAAAGNVAAAAGQGTGADALAQVREELANRSFSPQRVQQLEATVSELERKIADLARAERRNEALLEIARLTNLSFDPRMLLECVIDAVQRAMRADRCALLVLQQGLLVPMALRHMPAGLPAERWPLVNQALKGHGLVQAPPGFDGRPACCMPMRGKQGQPLGAAYLETPPGRPLQRDEIELLQAICQQIALALDNVLLLDSVRREEKRRESLSRYLPDKVVDLVLAGQMNLELGGAHRPVSVMFVDIRGFTSLSERLQPSDVLTMLNEYFSATTEAVFGADGTVDKYIGDALMAVFGAPVASSEHAARAVQAAVQVRRLVASLRHAWVGKSWSVPGAPPFDVGIGVNTGNVVAGNIGSRRRMEYTVIGDTVNLASRLCSNAARGQVLIGPETYEAVKHTVPTRPLAPLTVKGKVQPVQAYEVLDP